MNELTTVACRIAKIQGIIRAAVDAIYDNKLGEDEIRLQKAVIASATESLYEARREQDIVLQYLKIHNSLNTGPIESSNATKEVDEGKGDCNKSR